MSVGRSFPTEEGQRVNHLSPEQGEPLLRTKLYIPRIRATRVLRQGLLEQMNKSLDKTPTSR